MENKKWVSKSVKETQKIAKLLAKRLKPGMLVFFKGELGAGKTAFIQGLCKGLGVKKEATSPTFVLEKIYHGRRKRQIHHYDLYRLKDEAEVNELYINENLERGGICLIEWPAVAENVIQKPAVIVHITKLSETERNIWIVF